MKKIIILIILLTFCFPNKININTANIDELSNLELNKIQIQDIINYKYKFGDFDNIYELNNISSIDIIDIHRIKNYVTVIIPKASTFEQDIQRSSYKMGKWIANEGNTEGLSEIWLDKFFEPQNVNNMNYDDLMALPNLSPIDVTAVLKQQKRGYINGNWELKNSPNISYWGYKNLIDFVRFSNKSNYENTSHIRFNALFRTIPITSNPDDEGNIIAFKNTSLPEQFHKISITSGAHLKGGLTYHKYMGQPDSIYTIKGFLQLEKISLYNFINIERIVLGDYTVSLGQGVIFETNDNFSPRRTGFGFSKRAEGIYGDLTRSCQYVMRGAALQISLPKVLT